MSFNLQYIQFNEWILIPKIRESNSKMIRSKNFLTYSVCVLCIQLNSSGFLEMGIKINQIELLAQGVLTDSTTTCIIYTYFTGCLIDISSIIYSIHSMQMQDKALKINRLIRFVNINYRKVMSSNTSHLKSHGGFFRLKGMFNTFVL